MTIRRRNAARPLPHSSTVTWLGLAGWLAVTFVAAYVGTRFEAGAWYDALEKPAWTPPASVFGPLRTTLYVLMAIAAWLVWRRFGFAGARAALVVYLVQLVLNTGWSWLFFGEHDIAMAFTEIVALLVLIVITVVMFWRRDLIAGLLLLPYLGWVAFATALNFRLYELNG